MRSLLSVLLVCGLSGCARPPVAVVPPATPTPVAPVAAAPAPPKPEAPPVPMWQSYTSQDKRFSVKLPSPPRITSEHDSTRMQSILGEEVFLVTSVRLPHASSEADLKKFRRHFTRRMSARGTKVVSQTEHKVQGYPTLDLRVQAQDGRLLVSNRMIWAGDHFYTLSWVAQKDDQQGIKNLWDSFRIAKS